MSVKTRIESLEKRLAKPEPEETVVKVRIITVESREEVEQLRAAGLMDPRPDDGRPAPRGPVRLVTEYVTVEEALRTARATQRKTTEAAKIEPDATESRKTPSGADND